ncbi:MAG: hypothetical protein L6Q55_14000 [Azonexus sp.]|nr:hypothetical protein [Azonexus sp.]MCK6413516.1 hypothetical protein [Azonexus sp.]
MSNLGCSHSNCFVTQLLSKQGLLWFLSFLASGAILIIFSIFFFTSENIAKLLKIFDGTAGENIFSLSGLVMCFLLLSHLAILACTFLWFEVSKTKLVALLIASDQKDPMKVEVDIQ